MHTYKHNLNSQQAVWAAKKCHGHYCDLDDAHLTSFGCDITITARQLHTLET